MNIKHNDCLHFSNIDAAKGICRLTGNIIEVDSDACDSYSKKAKCKFCKNFTEESTDGIGTCVSNQLILANIRKLVNSNWSGELILRMPVIEGFNDTDENITALIDFMKDNSIDEINILPFHRMGETKWHGIGKDYSYSSFVTTSEETLSYIKNRFTYAGLECYIGSDTPF